MPTVPEPPGDASRMLQPKLSRHHAKTLAAVFADPVSASMTWKDVESLLVAVGCTLVEGSGSRVRFVNGDRIATFHRPHPAKEAKRYQIRDAREFLRRLGITP